MTIDDAYRTLGIARSAVQADAFAAYRAQSSRLASAPEQVIAEVNRAYEVVTQDIWRRAQPAPDDAPPDDEQVDTLRPADPRDAAGRRRSSHRKVVLLTVGLIIAALATLLVVAPTTGRNDDTGWSDESKAGLMEGCLLGSRGTDGACRCLVEKASATMSEEEFLRATDDFAADVVANGGVPRNVPDEILPLLTECFGLPAP